MELATIIVICIVIALVALIGGTLSINTGLININYKRSNDIYSSLVRLSKTYTELINNANECILKNQMIYAESAISEINNHINNNDSNLDIYHKAYVYYIIKNIIKTHCITNGFDSMDPGQFSKYVGNRIDLIREKYKEIVSSEYLDSHDFSEKIADVYHHALSCSNHWKSKIKELTEQRDLEIEKLIKGK